MPIQSATTSILDDLRRIVRVLRESSRAAERKLGVTGAQLFVLRALADARPLSVNTLAARTRTHQSTVSEVVKRLVDRRLVARTAAADDRRRVEIDLTASGRTLLRRAPLAAQDRLIAGLENLPRRHRDSLALGLARLVAAMGLDAQPAAMFFEDAPRRGGRQA